MKLINKFLYFLFLTLALINSASAAIVNWAFTADNSNQPFAAILFSYDTNTQAISSVSTTNGPNWQNWSLILSGNPDIFFSQNWTEVSFPLLVNNNNVDLIDRIYLDVNAQLGDITPTSGVKGIISAPSLINNYSGMWISSVTAVPEPESYAMMLAGLGLVGFAARRKQNNY